VSRARPVLAAPQPSLFSSELFWLWRLRLAEEEDDDLAVRHCERGLARRWVPSNSIRGAYFDYHEARRAGEHERAHALRVRIDRLLRIPSSARSTPSTQ